jgi:hypothetical protein
MHSRVKSKFDFLLLIEGMESNNERSKMIICMINLKHHALNVQILFFKCINNHFNTKSHW